MKNNVYITFLIILMTNVSLHIYSMDKTTKALFDAAGTAHYDQVKKFLDNGADITQCDEEGNSLFTLVLRKPPYVKDHAKIMQLLLKQKNSNSLINKTTFQNKTDDVTMLQLCLHGIVFQSESTDMASALEIITTLIRNGENPHLENNRNQDAITLAREFELDYLGKFMENEYAAYSNTGKTLQNSAQIDESTRIVERLKNQFQSDYNRLEDLLPSNQHQSQPANKKSKEHQKFKKRKVCIII